MIYTSENHARTLAGEENVSCLCHADLHAGNLHLALDGTLYLIDWDTVEFAPKERDLMFVGAGLIGGHRDPADEHRLFFTGYGEANVSNRLLSYYRYERILEDIALYAEELSSGLQKAANPWQSFGYLESNFDPAGTIDLAFRADERI